jgi:hypothetical protein
MLKSSVYYSKSSGYAFKSHWWYPLASVEGAGSDFGTVSPTTKVEASRALARDENRNFYWIETLENYLHTDPKSGEGRFAQGGG